MRQGAASGPELRLSLRPFAGAATAVRESENENESRRGYPAAYVGLGVLALPSETCQAHARSKPDGAVEKFRFFAA